MDVSATLGTALAGRYTIEREIGRGGMAVVYLARHLRHDRKVALKLLDPEPVGRDVITVVHHWAAEVRARAAEAARR